MGVMRGNSLVVSVERKLVLEKRAKGHGLIF